MTIFIRLEQLGDEQIIDDLTVAAFKPMPFSDGSEASIIAGLREDGDLTISLVAVDGAEIVGHVAFSPFFIKGESEGWYGLGPVSVWPHRQRQGIGSALINEGLSILKIKGAKGCALVGDPNYYVRFGFRGGSGLTYRDLPTQYVQSLSFAGDTPVGQLKFSSAFDR